MKALPVITAVLFAAVFASCLKRTPTDDKTFNGSFGERFEHSPDITIDHNPHGGATKAFFSYDGAPIGEMTVAPRLPENVPDDVMKDVIVESTKKTYAATSVKHSKLTNRFGYVFDHFSSDAHHDGADYRYDLFLYIDTRSLSSSAQSFITERFGMHKFEFIVQDERYKVISPLINSIIDSFRPSWTSN